MKNYLKKKKIEKNEKIYENFQQQKFGMAQGTDEHKEVYIDQNPFSNAGATRMDE